MQDRMNPGRPPELAAEERRRMIEREKEFLSFSEMLSEQEKEVQTLRARLKEEQIAREREFQKELSAREKMFAEREKQLQDRQRDFERQLLVRQSETEGLRRHLVEELALRESKLQHALAELQQEKERYNEENRKRIEQNSKSYVTEALDLLARKERHFHRISIAWGLLGAISLICGSSFFVYVTLRAPALAPGDVTWPILVLAVLKGLVAIGLLAGLAKYSLNFSTSYMREVLKNADRTHAINFGKFYLQSHGAAAEWSQVKEAFANWNINGSNAFNRGDDAGFDVDMAEKADSLSV